MRSGTVIKHGAEGFAGMRKAGQLAAAVLDMITPHVQPGVTTDELNTLCHEYMVDELGTTPVPHAHMQAPLVLSG